MIDLLIKPAGCLISMAGASDSPRRAAQMADLGLLRDAAVGINSESGLIEYVGPASAVSAKQLHPDCEVFDARGRVVMPGFVDCHTHLVFGGDRADEFYKRAAGVSYAEIASQGGGIRKTMEATRAASSKELFESAWQRYLRLLENGTTAVECKSGYGLNIDSERLSMQVIRDLSRKAPGVFMRTYMGAHLIPPDFAERRIEYVEQVAGELAYFHGKDLCDFYDIFVDPLAFSQQEAQVIVDRGRELGMKLRLHADEFGDDGTAAWGVANGAVSADHLGGIGDEGIKALAGSETIATLLPGTMFFSGHGEYAPARRMIDSGCAVALATDLNPGSSLMYSLPLVMTLAVLEMKMTAAECLNAVTINAAHALCLADRIGSIEVGKQADILILDCETPEEIAYQVGTNLVSDVIVNGDLIKRHGVMLF
ncbi:MAG: imidazolonepropionase [Planctomycetales bacterium]|nr:imidazolonepropionase [bacterium]UNM07707.1 MAG: imidazolonepropionase [Planctomycetales bacterium]